MTKSIKVKLTQALVAKALSDRGGPKVYRDTEVAGFYLRVGARSASFYLDYKPPGRRSDGRQFPSNTIRIGTTASHSLSEARLDAARLKLEVANGGDPAADKRAARAAAAIEKARATTMQEAAELYIGCSLSGSAGHFTTESGALRLGIKEMGLEDAAPGDVTTQDVLQMLAMHKGQACAVHRLGALNRFFDDLVSRDVVKTNPCARVPKRHKPKPASPRTRVYTAEEVQALWSTTGLSDVQLRYLRAAILLPLRFGELCELRASEVELDQARIVLPGKRTKNGDPFTLPLPEKAIGLLSPAGHEDERDPRVFPLSQVGKSFKSWTPFKDRVRRGSGISDFNFHDLRRTFMTVLAEQGIGDPAVADALLNHRQSATRAGVSAAYNQAALSPQKTRMMEAWGVLVESAVECGEWVPEANVVALRGRNSD